MLVLLHGYCGSQQDFAHLLPKLERFTPIFTYDHRGHGEARDQGASGEITLESLADDLRARLDAQNLKKAHFLGHSMGGKVLLRFALAHPERIASLILVGTGANPVALGPPVRKSWKDRARALIGRDAVPRMAAALYATDEARRSFIRAARRAEAAVHPHAIAELHRAIVSSASLTDRLKELRAPTTVMVGEHDAIYRRDAAELAQKIPGAKFVLFAHSSHYPHFEQEAAFIEAVREHLNQIVETKTS